MKQNLVLDVAEPMGKKYHIETKKEKNVIIQHFLVKDGKTEKEKEHYTISFDDMVLYQKEDVLKKTFYKIFKKFLCTYYKGGSILIVGLGNSSIIGDAFGPKILHHLIATNQYNDFLTIPKVALFSPETTNKTGISSLKLIDMVVRHMKPDVILLMDSFVTKHVKYLNRTIEINNCGMIFADQVRTNRNIDEFTFHIPVISIGIPTLFSYEKTYLAKFSLEQDLEILIRVIARAINHTIMS